MTAKDLTKTYLSPNEKNIIKQGGVVRQILEVASTMSYILPWESNYPTATAAASAAISNSGGGTIIVPAGQSPTLPTSAPSVVWDYYGPNVNMNTFNKVADNLVTANRLFRGFNPTNHTTIVETLLGVEMTAAGCGSAPGSTSAVGADEAIQIAAIKQNWGQNPSVSNAGTVQALYCVVKNDGPVSAPPVDNGDTSGILVDCELAGTGGKWMGGINAFESNTACSLSTGGGEPWSIHTQIASIGSLNTTTAQFGYGMLVDMNAANMTGQNPAYWARNPTTSANWDYGFLYSGPGLPGANVFFSVNATGDIFGNTIQNNSLPFSSLGTASSFPGRRAMLINATTAASWGTSVTTGNSTGVVPVYSDGTVWRFG